MNTQKKHTKLNKTKTTLAIGVFIFATILSTLAPRAGVLAQTADICDPNKELFEKSKSMLPSLDIRGTVVNMMITATSDGVSSVAFNGSYKDLVGCTTYIKANVPEMASIFDSIGDTSNCPQSETTFCESLVNSYADPQTGLIRPSTGRVQGSLLGLGRVLEAGVYDPPVVNLAYYANKQIAKVPFIGNTVLAQSGSASYAGWTTMLDIVYKIWESVRNISFGIMSIVMVVAGIMIMTRRKINPQSVVTLQYALPRIIIALVLIWFSYPIGAALSALFYTLSFSAGSIVSSLNISSGTGGGVALAGIGTLISGLVITGLAVPGLGMGIIIILGILLLVTLLVYLAANIKFYVVYFKFLIEIILAPIKFALGAVPGNETMTINWFKKVLAYGLGMFALSIILRLTFVVALTVVATGAASPGAGSLVIGFLAPFVGFFVVIFGLNQARKVPDTIHDAIMGEKRK